MDRFDLVKESFERKVVPAEVPAGKTSDYFGELVFDRKKMCKYLDAGSLYDLRRPIDRLEEVVDNKLWPLPKYRELLFIN